jgi:hypothetical protein
LYWANQAGLTYHVYRRTQPSNGSFFRLDNPDGSLTDRGVADGSFLDTSVNPGLSYDYILVAEDDVGAYSSPSGLLSVDAACAEPGLADGDGDGVANICDNCPGTANAEQADGDGNGVGDACENCCGLYTGGVTGNIDCDPDGLRQLVDITMLIDHVYLRKLPLCCTANANTNGDAEGSITLVDITTLIDHVYIHKNETAPCQ